MTSEHELSLAGVAVRSATGDVLLSVIVADDIDDPIAVLRTQKDPAGSTMDLDKALLFREGHGFDRGDLRTLCAWIKELRGSNVALSE
jgi:hypothetical protein